MKDEELEIEEITDIVRSLCLSVAYNTHHFDHILRVHGLCVKIAKHYPVDLVVLRASALLHDVGHLIPNEQTCHAEESAKFTIKLLTERYWPAHKINQVAYAVGNHRYRKNVIPHSLEAKILQDSDRLEALGAIGIIRVLTYDLELPLYDLNQPFSDLGDRSYRLNHFYEKILKLKDNMHTAIASEMATERDAYVRSFLEQLRSEIQLI